VVGIAEAPSVLARAFSTRRDAMLRGEIGYDATRKTIRCAVFATVCCTPVLMS
jgi:hypothetical protein